MAAINLTTIQEQLPEGWKVTSTSYKNLDSEMEFECPAGHKVYNTWKRIRQRAECPICREKAPLFDMKVIPKPKGSFRVLGLDQATHITGFSIYTDNVLTKFGIFNSVGNTETERNHMTKMWLCSMIENWGIDLIGIEGLQLQQNASRNIGVTTFETLARLQGILMEAAYENKVEFIICPTNTWRAHCGVKGQTREAKKKSMQQLAREWHSVNASEDEADAIGIGKYTAEVYGKKRVVQNWE